MMIPAGPDNKKAVQMHGLVIWIRYLQKVVKTVSFDFRTKKHIPGQNLNVTALPAWNHAGFFLPKEKAHRSGPYSYHHFLLGVVPGASR